VNCDDFEARLQDLLDQRFPPGDDLELVAHSLQCEPCREQLEWQQTSLASLRWSDARSPRVSADFADRVVQLARLETSRPAAPECGVRRVAPDRLVPEQRTWELRGRVSSGRRWVSSLAAWGMALSLCLLLVALWWGRGGRWSGEVPLAIDGEIPLAWQTRGDTRLPVLSGGMPSDLSWGAGDSWRVFPPWESLPRGPYRPGPDDPLALRPDSTSYQIWISTLTAQWPDVAPSVAAIGRSDCGWFAAGGGFARSGPRDHSPLAPDRRPR
jgi:hypothetical protein